MIANTASTPNPNKRNGNEINQTIGYKTSASSASGQHRQNRINHNKKLTIRPPGNVAGEPCPFSLRTAPRRYSGFTCRAAPPQCDRLREEADELPNKEIFGSVDAERQAQVARSQLHSLASDYLKE
jgi:hypothetical protein